MTPGEATARFAEAVGAAEPSVRLDEAALLIAACANPGLEIGSQLARLDRLAELLPSPTLDGLRQLLFRDLGFVGNTGAYDDPRNSYLDQVLDRRTGIPISLSIVMMEVGRRAGVPLAGVSMPGHFLVRDKVDPTVFVDPFAAGRLLDRDGARRRFLQVQGAGARFDDAFLEPVGPRAIVVRMLANLEGIADRRNDIGMSGWVLRLRCTVPGAELGDHLRLAAALQAQGRYDQAAAAVAAYAPATDGEVDRVRRELARLRAKLN